MARSRSELSYAVSAFQKAGMTRNQALGALGSLAGESGRNLNTKAHNPKDPNGGSFGLGQWHSERKTGLDRFAARTGRKNTDFKTQIDYVVHELKTTEKRTLQKMQANPGMTRAQAAKTWTDNYERPNQKYAQHDKRAQNAEYFAGVIDGNRPLAGDNISLTGANIPGERTRMSEKTRQAMSKTQAGSSLAAIEQMTGGVGNDYLAAPEALSYAEEKNSRGGGNGGGIGGSLEGIGDFFGGLATGGLTGVDNQDVDGGFFGKPNTAAIVGTIGGGLIMGMPGAIIGGMLGQAIGRSLSNIGHNQLNPGMERDSFAEAPDGPREAKSWDRYSESDKSRMRDMSPKAAKEIERGGSKGPSGIY